MPKNEKCVVTDTTVCKFIDKDCKDCFINNMKDEQSAQKTLEDFEVTLSLLPDDIDELQGDECCFCISKKQKRAKYAIVDIGHSEPETTRGAIFGFGKKVRQRIGSLLPLSISICKKCRGAFWMLDIIKWASLLFFGSVAIGICFIPAVNENPVLPYGVVMIGIVIGYIMGKVLSTLYLKAKGRQTRFNVFDIPVCAKMKENGWFTIQDNSEVTHFLFSRKPMLRRISDVRECTSADRD